MIHHTAPLGEASRFYSTTSAFKYLQSPQVVKKQIRNRESGASQLDFPNSPSPNLTHLQFGGSSSTVEHPVFPFTNLLDKMISGIFIFNQKGEVLISRLYRHDLKRSIADVFRIHVLSSTDIRSPITTLGSTTFFHVKRDNIYIVAVTKVNANAALVFEFLHRLVDGIGRSYFGKMDEEGVKNNFVLIYELLDGLS
jgi:hypothetical protein